MEVQSSIRIVVVDDHPVVRIGICAMIRSQQDMRVVGEYGTATDALASLRTDHPDVLLMDLRLPGISGVEAIRIIHQKHPEIRIVVLTTYEGDEDIHQAIEAGAAAYIIKGMESGLLLRGIRRVFVGNTYLPPDVSRTIEARPADDLSRREREVLSLMAQGMSNRAIANDLGITEGTVKCHVAVILEHFDATDRTQAVLMALRRGYVQL